MSVQFSLKSIEKISYYFLANWRFTLNKIRKGFLYQFSLRFLRATQRTLRLPERAKVRAGQKVTECRHVTSYLVLRTSYEMQEEFILTAPISLSSSQYSYNPTGYHEIF
jgi:hypothetical protein